MRSFPDGPAQPNAPGRAAAEGGDGWVCLGGRAAQPTIPEIKRDRTTHMRLIQPALLVYVDDLFNASHFLASAVENRRGPYERVEDTNNFQR
jgi:hypothetical protein